MTILLKASKTKISSNSHKIAIAKVDSMIDEAIKSLNKPNNELSFIDVGLVFQELKIFREIFKKEDNNNTNNFTSNRNNDKKEYQSYKDIKIELKNVKERERRKKFEVDFYEQIWLLLNPENKETIKSEVLAEFLKILFSPVVSSVKEISEIVKQFLKAVFFLSLGNEENKTYVSPINERILEKDEIWPVEKIVKEFLSLKDNLLAYKGIGNFTKKAHNEIEKFNVNFIFN